MNWQAVATFLADDDQRPVFAVDPIGLVRLFNVAAERLLGWRRDEVIGQPWDRLIEPARRAAFAAALRGRRGRHEVSLRSAAGDRVVADLVLHPVVDLRGERGLIGVVEPSGRDDHARAAINQRHLRDQLEALARRHRLSGREREVLDHLARGDSVEAIGAALGITPRTAKFHQANVLAKLGLDSRVELIGLLLEPARRRR